MSERNYYEAYNDRYQQVHSRKLQWFQEEPTPIVSRILQAYGIPRNGRILEIGCGEGRDAFALLEKGWDLLATDVSPEAISYCAQRMPEKGDCFQVLDCVTQELQERFDFIYAVAVIHMLVEDDHRDAFYRFIRRHLKPGGLGLICSMGDGTIERSTDTRAAFQLCSRCHGKTGQTMEIAATSCRMVTLPRFHEEMERNGLKILKAGLTASEPDFPVMMYALVTALAHPEAC